MKCPRDLVPAYDRSQLPTASNKRKWFRAIRSTRRRKKSAKPTRGVRQEEGKVESFVKAKENRGKWWETSEACLLFARPRIIRGTRLPIELISVWLYEGIRKWNTQRKRVFTLLPRFTWTRETTKRITWML